MKKMTAVFWALACASAVFGGSAPASFKTEDIHIRDPFIVTDAAKGRYLLLSSYFAPAKKKGNDGFGFLGTGAKVYISRDLKTFEPPKQVLDIPQEIGCRALWAPEMHQYKGKWYIFGTVNYRQNPSRGTWTFVADSPEGPFRPTGKRSITPPEWYALDGTLWVEGGKPYMVFCHEWLQIGNGEMCYVEMTDDLSAPVGQPKTLFKATDFSADAITDSRHKATDHVTDGPFLYRSPKSGKLFMIWSNVTHASGYADILCESASGKLAGPWIKHRILYGKDGGHGMLFRKLDGSLALTLHQPNRSPHERLRIFDVEDDGETLKIVTR